MRSTLTVTSNEQTWISLPKVFGKCVKVVVYQIPFSNAIGKRNRHRYHKTDDFCRLLLLSRELLPRAWCLVLGLRKNSNLPYAVVVVGIHACTATKPLISVSLTQPDHPVSQHRSSPTQCARQDDHRRFRRRCVTAGTIHPR